MADSGRFITRWVVSLPSGDGRWVAPGPPAKRRRSAGDARDHHPDVATQSCSRGTAPRRVKQTASRTFRQHSWWTSHGTRQVSGFSSDGQRAATHGRASVKSPMGEDVRFSVEIPDGSPDHCLTLQATRAADLGCLRSASSAARRPGKARYPSMRRNCFSATTSPEPTQRSI